MDGSVISEHGGCTERIAALEQHVSELEKSLESARKERDEATSKVVQLEATNRRLNALTLHDADGRLMTQGALNALFSQYRAAGDVLGEVIGLRNVHPGRGETPVMPPRHAASKAMWETVQERDAALADNAAKEEAFAAYIAFHGAEHEEDDCPEDATCKCPHLVALNAAFGPGHPGAALLEKHREELAAAARRHETTRATMQVREEEHRRAAETSRNALNNVLEKLREELARHGVQCVEGGLVGSLNGIDRVAVRARNEGLEKAAAKAREMGRIFRAEAAQRSDASRDAWLMAASGAADIGNAIAALKELEGGQS